MQKKVLSILNKDPVLKNITHLKLLPLQNENDIVIGLLKSIVSQQLSVKAADTIYNRFLDLFSFRKPTPRKILAKSTEILRSSGLSRNKANYIKNIAQWALENKADKKDWTAISSEDIFHSLIQIKGVGAWTANIVLLFSLRRDNIFPVGDLTLQQSIKELYGLNEEGKELIVRIKGISEKWAPYKSWAARYLWAWKDQVV